MNAESSRLRSTDKTSSDIRAIWPGALLTVYLVVTGVMLVAGRANVRASDIAVHFAVLGVMAAITWLPIIPDGVRRWAPLLTLLFLYSEMPALIRAAGHLNVFDWRVMQWEGALFGGQPAHAWAARSGNRVLSELLHLAYVAYYPIIYSIPLVLFVTGRHDEFSEAAFALLLTFITCFLAYIAFPVAGPRYLWPSAAPDGWVRGLVVSLLEARSSRGTAFPSSHVAVAVAQSILAVRYFGARGAAIGIVTVALALGAVYGGFHYAVDVLAGLITGLFAVGVALAAVRRMPLRERQGADVTAAEVRT